MITIATFMTSAVWHGFYPGYFIVFFIFALMFEAAKDIWKLRQKFIYPVLPNKTVRAVVAHVLTNVTAFYGGIVFTALTLENGLKFMNATFFAVPIGLVTILVLVRGLGLKPDRSPHAQSQKPLSA